MSNDQRYQQLQTIMKKSSKLLITRHLTPRESIQFNRFMSIIDEAVLHPEKVPQDKYEKLLMAYFEFLTELADQSEPSDPKINYTKTKESKE